VSARDQATTRPLARAILLGALAWSVAACAGARPPLTDAASGAPAGTGYKALFRGDSRGPEGRTRFRMGVALLPPSRLRLEFFAPVGNPRLIVTTDGATATALLPARRAYDHAPATAETMERLVGVPLAAEDLIALLTGRPMCRPEAVDQQVNTRSAPLFGGTVAWYEVTCPPGDIRYQAVRQERGGLLERATIREGISGAMMLEVEYGDHEAGSGPRWPRQIRLHLARQQAKVTLTAIDGPWRREIAEEIFAPAIPDNFERRPEILSLSAPGFLGSVAEGEE
jgi:hypothetical protein